MRYSFRELLARRRARKADHKWAKETLAELERQRKHQAYLFGSDARFYQ